MKFKRDDLVGRVKAAIEAEKKRVEERNIKLLAEFEQKRQTYIDSTKADWQTFAANVRASVRRGQPVTPADVPESLYAKGWIGDKLRLWSASEPEPAEPRTGELEQILSVLEACTDEEITTNALERFGIKLAPIFRRHSI